MKRERKPADFDWVTARAACSAVHFFERLVGQARGNVAKRQAIAEEEKEHSLPKLTFVLNGHSFAVSADRLDLDRPVVRVRLAANGVIYANMSGVAASDFQGSVVLGDDGECRLHVDGDDLDEWQVLRRALEPILFLSEPV